MNAPQDRPQAPQSPVPAGDALGPPDTPTGACGPSQSEPAPVRTSSTGRFWPSGQQPTDPAAAGLLCTPAERALIDLVLAWRSADSIVFRPLFSLEVLAEHLPQIRATADRVLADREARP